MDEVLLPWLLVFVLAVALVISLAACTTTRVHSDKPWTVQNLSNAIEAERGNMHK